MFVHYEEAGYLDDQFLHGLLHYVNLLCNHECMYVCMYITLKQVFKFIAAP